MLEITQTIKKIMELDRYICDRCGKSHEVCKCIDLEQDLFILAQLEEFDSLEEDDYFVNENTYPKISTHLDFTSNGDDKKMLENKILVKEIVKEYLFLEEVIFYAKNNKGENHCYKAISIIVAGTFLNDEYFIKAVTYENDFSEVDIIKLDSVREECKYKFCNIL